MFKNFISLGLLQSYEVAQSAKVYIVIASLGSMRAHLLVQTTKYNNQGERRSCKLQRLKPNKRERKKVIMVHHPLQHAL